MDSVRKYNATLQKSITLPNMRYCILALICCFTTVLTASNYFKVIYIAAETVKCDTSSCLLSRTSPDENWEKFNHSIKGFNYKEGFEYCLLIEVLVNDTTKQSTYILSEIKSKQNKHPEILSEANFSLIADSSKWLLYKLKTKDGIKTFSLQKVVLQFDYQNNTISGSTDCNSYKGEFLISENRLSFDNITTTKINCKKTSVEPDYLKAISSVTHYKMTSKLLYLYKEKTLVALFTLKK